MLVFTDDEESESEREEEAVKRTTKNPPLRGTTTLLRTEESRSWQQQKEEEEDDDDDDDVEITLIEVPKKEVKVTETPKTTRRRVRTSVKSRPQRTCSCAFFWLVWNFRFFYEEESAASAIDLAERSDFSVSLQPSLQDLVQDDLVSSCLSAQFCDSFTVPF
ncbi:unnamed protein product [Rodentolepis nana]|uniref:Uncharacterized protein n=1 Tax=Rodentolepis nana TaxID=102285 RepID=A0A0R3TY68_RODNA|nr:unnamed protein product [Rodentolepis nana]